MGSFVFKWDHPASEVYVTGTFDDWSKSEKLDSVGNGFSKDVTLSSADEKIYYKFVVDGNWVTDHTAPQENDASGNLNNVLTTDRIIKHTPKSTAIMSGVTPQSTSADLAKDVPLEKSESASSGLPGSFPETPAADFAVNPLPAFAGGVNPTTVAHGEKLPETSSLTNNTITSGVHDDPELVEKLKAQDAKKESEQTFGVAPLPAFPGGVNPIQLAPGEKVPDASTLTGNTIHSNVHTDAASYEKGAGVSDIPSLPPVVTPQAERDDKGTGVFDLPPVSKNLIPESSLPIGESASKSADAGPYTQSAGPQSTTAALAADVPLESTKVPEIVKESQQAAGVDPEASAVTEEVREKSEVEKELESKVPEAPATSEGIAGQGTTKSETQVTAGEAAAAVGGAAVALGGAAVAAGSGLLGKLPAIPASVTSKLPTGVQESINNINADADSKIAAAKNTPEVVQNSIAQFGKSPEAAANEEAVVEKTQVEKELLSEVKKVNSSGESAPKIAESATASADKAPVTPIKKLQAPLIAQEPESRDVSPGTIPGSRVQTNQEQDAPVVTSGVGSTTTAEKSTPAKPVTEATTPSKPAASSNKITESPASGSASQKKKNRASAFFSKIKSKLSDK